MGDRLKTRVFISYAHQDLIWLHRLHVHLKPLMRSSQVDFWDDTRIQPGMDWRRAVASALSSASVAVLLISPHFLASDSIVENQLTPLLQAAESSGTTILSLIFSLLGEIRADVFMPPHAAVPGDPGPGSGLRPGVREWGLQS